MTMEFSDYCELREVNYQTAYTAIWKRDQIGKMPSYIKKGKCGYVIDITELDKRLDERHASWVFATSYTYFWLTDWMKMSVNQIAIEMSKRSKKFKNRPSWCTFLNSDLFAIPKHSPYNDDRSMCDEFVVHGTAMALAYYRDNY